MASPSPISRSSRTSCRNTVPAIPSPSLSFAAKRKWISEWFWERTKSLSDEKHRFRCVKMKGGFFSRPLVCNCDLQASEKRRQVFLLLLGHADVKAVIVEVDHVQQRCRRSIMEVGRPCGQAAKHRPFELADVTPLA